MPASLLQQASGCEGKHRTWCESRLCSASCEVFGKSLAIVNSVYSSVKRRQSLCPDTGWHGSKGQLRRAVVDTRARLVVRFVVFSYSRFSTFLDKLPTFKSQEISHITFDFSLFLKGQGIWQYLANIPAWWLLVGAGYQRFLLTPNSPSCLRLVHCLWLTC